MALHIENPKNRLKIALELISKFNKVEEYKVNVTSELLG